MSYAREVLDSLQYNYEQGETLYRKSYKKQTPVSEQSFLEAKILYSKFKNFEEYLLRIELSTLNVYSNDKAWLEELSNCISKDSIISFWEPNESYITVLDSNTIIVNEDNGYEYKVTLGNKRGRKEFSKFARVNPHLVKVGPVLMEEMDKNGYVNNLYFYARDKKVLQLCNLLLDNIRRIDKLVVKSNIDK